MARVLFLTLLLLGALMLGNALPTLTGPTGMIALPNAQPAPQRLMLSGDVAENPGDRGIFLRALAGFTSGELGVLYNVDDENTLGVNGKVVWPTVWGMTAALGGFDLDGTLLTERCAYLAVTKPGPLSFTGGVTWTEIRTPAGSADALRPYIGAELALPGVIGVKAEYQMKSATLMESRPLTSIMLVRGNGLITTTIGMTNAQGVLSTGVHYYFAGFSFALAP